MTTHRTRDVLHVATVLPMVPRSAKVSGGSAEIDNEALHVLAEMFVDEDLTDGTARPHVWYRVENYVMVRGVYYFAHEVCVEFRAGPNKGEVITVSGGCVLDQ